jgi:hypothetical protein
MTLALKLDRLRRCECSSVQSLAPTIGRSHPPHGRSKRERERAYAFVVKYHTFVSSTKLCAVSAPAVALAVAVKTAFFFNSLL